MQSLGRSYRSLELPVARRLLGSQHIAHLGCGPNIMGLVSTLAAAGSMQARKALDACEVNDVSASIARLTFRT